MRLRAPLYGDHYLSQVFGTFELSKSLPEILHREGPVDHRLQLAGFIQLIHVGQVFIGLQYNDLQPLFVHAV